MKKLISSLLFLLLIYSCSNKSNYNHLKTDKIENHLYMEIYIDVGIGAYSNDHYQYYLTDSIHFKKVIGESDSDSYIEVKKINKKIISVVKRTKKTVVKKSKLISENQFDITELKRDGNWEKAPSAPL